FIEQSAGSVYPTTNVNTPIYTDGTVSIIADASSAYVRGSANWYTPRQFNGGVVYHLRAVGPNDASVASLISPQQFCVGTHPISVSIMNAGNNLITTVDVHWELDGVAQPPVSYNSPIDTIGSVNGSTASVVLGNHNFTGGPVQLKVWTSNPNGMLDTVNGNDTLYATLVPSLSGVYTINQGVPASATNFTSLTAFANALNAYGVCGPVVADVVPGSGPYNEVVVFNNIVGANSVNTIRLNGNGEELSFSSTGTSDHRLFVLN